MGGGAWAAACWNFAVMGAAGRPADADSVPALVEAIVAFDYGDANEIFAVGINAVDAAFPGSEDDFAALRYFLPRARTDPSPSLKFLPRRYI
jgi:hypothetical protein